MPKVHTYTRFSRLKSARGDSLARQTEIAERFGREELERAAAESAAKAERLLRAISARKGAGPCR